MRNPPGRFNDNSPLGNWLDALRECLVQARILESSDIYPSITEDGTMLNLRKGGAGGSGGGSFKGEYNSTVSYAAQDIVKVSTGAGAGTYVAVQAVTQSTTVHVYPWLGDKWTLIGKFMDQSNWL